MKGHEIKNLTDILKAIKGEDVKINISHKLYGDQQIRCIFSPIVNEHIGFNIKGQSIYMDKKGIQKICLENNIYFADDVMEITIRV